MDRTTPSAPGFDAQPPPYSETAPPQSIPIVRAIPIPVYTPQPYYQPQRPGYYGPESVIQTHVVTRQPGTTVHVVTSSPLFGPNPRSMVCTVCNQNVTSKIIQEPSTRTHLLAFSLCLIGCWPCAPCVYCMDCCLRSNHYCPNCNSYQGSFIPSY